MMPSLPKASTVYHVSHCSEYPHISVCRDCVTNVGNGLALNLWHLAKHGFCIISADTSDDTLGNDRSLRSWFARLGQNQAGQEQRDKMIKAFLYAVQVFYSFFIMLLFMTYNGFIMLAVAVGAFIGYLAFGQGPSAKTVACH